MRAREALGAALARVAWPVVYAHRRKVNRQAGVALVMVTVTVAILAAVVGEFGYNARVELESAANARDQLRAEYLARSGINLSRLLIKTQQSVIDPLNNQLKMDIQIGDFAPFLMKAFGGADGAEALGDLLGLSASSIKGLGVGKGGSFDVVMATEDGKVNINCGGGLNAAGGGLLPGAAPPPPVGSPPPNGPLGALPPATNPATALYRMLASLMFSPRYNRLFDNPDADGQYATRDEVARAIIDWSDIDETKFDPLNSSGNSEDYHYDALRDSYKAHNNYFDTLEELQLVRGVGDDWWGSFGEMLTVYGGCKVNLNAVKPDHWPIVAAVLRASVAQKDLSNPALLDDVTMAALSQQIMAQAQMMGGLSSPDQLNTATQKGGQLPLPANGGPLAALLGANGGQPPDTSSLFPPIPGLQGGGISLDPNTLKMLTRVGPREVYRLDSTGTIQRAGSKKIEVHIRAIFDTKHFNQNTTSIDVNDRQGTWVYWRMD